jgi:hypothetical protein
LTYFYYYAKDYLDLNFKEENLCSPLAY